MEKKKFKNLKTYLITSAISFVIGVGFFCLFFFVRGKTIGYGLINWQDSTLIAGIIVACVGALMGVAREGFFDIFAYGFKQLGTSMFAKDARTYNDFAGYREEKKNKRKASPKIFISVLIIAALCLLAALFVYLAAKSVS